MRPTTKGKGSKTPSPKPAGKFKSAVTGHYVSKHYATTHPKTTFKTSK